ncbi:MAG: OmpA family protein [Gammaproteobacteria bacterium]
MNKPLITAASLGALLISGCASTPLSTIEPFPARDLNELLTSGQYQQKTDNFFVINDSSSSMTEDYEGSGYEAGHTPAKFAVEKEILSRMNQTIPDLKLTTSIRSFGMGPCTGWDGTQLNLPPTAYSKSAFSAGIDALTCSSGASPMHKAVENTTSDLAATSGQIAVLILSDGHGLASDPVPAVQALKQQYGKRLCVYSIWVGNKDEENGKLLLNSLSDIAGCGYRAEAENVATPAGMAEFVKSVFLKRATPVADCSTMDSDGDGVNDCNDKCPDTPKGAHVDETGCWAYHGVLFDIDKANIKPEFEPMLNNAVDVMGLNPGLTVRIEGHTDSTASEEHNQKLSERRAESVKNYLVDHNVNASRMETVGYGESRPVDTNDTVEGRYNNRRVQFERTDR